MKVLSKIQTSLTVRKDQSSPDGKLKYKFRKAEDILMKVKPFLTESGYSLTMSDEVVEVAGRPFLKANVYLHNADGVCVTNTVAYAEIGEHYDMCNEQTTGCASSYARKYALCGMFAIDDSEHDPDAIEPTEEEVVDLAKKATNAEQLNSCVSYAIKHESEKVCNACKAKAAELGLVFNNDKLIYEKK